MSLRTESLGRKLRATIGGHFEDKVRRSSNPLMLKARKALGQPHVTLGKLSVIIPIYNVERYLEECLQSVQDQNYPDLEILMINDGSPDKSIEIAKKFARSDKRFKLINKVNAGLGAARNTGIYAATGKYITFLDSDDAVPYDAYKKMIITLNESGSDFVVGGVERWKGTRRWKAEWATRVHSHDRLRLTLDDLPEVTMDVFAWNKVFLRSFFDEHVTSFPEGILYEDQEPTAKAYSASKSFDVLEDTTYFWRIREDGSSITQNKLKIKDLTDRITVARSTGAVYSAHASEYVYRYWLQKTAGFDFGQYYRLAPRGDEEYWEALVAFTSHLTQKLTKDDWESVPVKERVLAHVIAQGDKESASKLIGAQAQYQYGAPVVRSDSGFDVDVQRWDIDAESIPSHVLALSAIDTPLRTGITNIAWTTSQILQIEGYAYIDKIPVSITDSRLMLEAKFEDGTTQDISLQRTSFSQTDLQRPMNSFVEFLESKISAIIDVQKLLEGHESASFRLTYTHEGMSRSANWIPQSIATVPNLNPSVAENGKQFEILSNRTQGITVSSREFKYSISEVQFKKRLLSFIITAQEALSPGTVVFTCDAAGLEVKSQYPPLAEGVSQRIVVELPVPHKIWQRTPVALWCGTIVIDEKTYPLPYPQTSFHETSPIDLQYSKGAFTVIDSPWKSLVRSVQQTDGGFTLSGDLYSQTREMPKVVFGRADGTLLEPISMEVTNSSFEARFEIGREASWGKPYLSPTSGAFGLCLMTQDEVDIFRYSRVIHFADSLRNGSRYSFVTRSGNAVLTDTGVDRSILLRLSGPRDPHDHRNRSRLPKIEHLREKASASEINSRLAVCMSFSGSSTGDSPRDLARELLDRGIVDEVVWGVADMDLEVDAGMRKIPVDSTEFITLLHRAKWLINSAHFPHYFRKRAGQYYIQTWHGTPLKKIANDVPPTSLGDSYRDLMAREVSYWDILLAQSPTAGDLLSKAFGYEGPVIGLGYPRNDSLFQKETMDNLAAVFREANGIRPDQRVVLYAPTWRDNASSGIGAENFEGLDYTRALNALGPDSILLLRGHSNTMAQDRKVNENRVLDVSGHNNLTQLFAASDLLITDYSSIFFDYIHTGKPIFGFVPDLEAYSSTIRGMYFDYEEVFPGVITKSNDELIEALKKPFPGNQLQNELLDSIASSELGNSAKRVVDEMLRLFEGE